MERRGKIATLGATAVAAVSAGTAEFGHDALGLVRGTAHEHPPPIRVHLPPAGPGPIVVGGSAVAVAAGHVRAARDDFVEAAVSAYGATPEAARKAATTAACGVLEVVVEQGRVPTGWQWGKIATESLSDAALKIPFPSGAWFRFQQVKAETLAGVEDEYGLPHEDEAQSLGNELACAWA